MVPGAAGLHSFQEAVQHGEAAVQLRRYLVPPQNDRRVIRPVPQDVAAQGLGEKADGDVGAAVFIVAGHVHLDGGLRAVGQGQEGGVPAVLEAHRHALQAAHRLAVFIRHSAAESLQHLAAGHHGAAVHHLGHRVGELHVGPVHHDAHLAGHAAQLRPGPLHLPGHPIVPPLVVQPLLQQAFPEVLLRLQEPILHKGLLGVVIRRLPALAGVPIGVRVEGGDLTGHGGLPTLAGQGILHFFLIGVLIAVENVADAFLPRVIAVFFPQRWVRVLRREGGYRQGQCQHQRQQYRGQSFHKAPAFFPIFQLTEASRLSAVTPGTPLMGLLNRLSSNCSP